MNKGIVKWFNNSKGYGFITGEDGKDIFVHYSNIVSDKEWKSLEENDNVTYDVGINEDGRTQAVNVMTL